MSDLTVDLNVNFLLPAIESLVKTGTNSKDERRIATRWDRVFAEG